MKTIHFSEMGKSMGEFVAGIGKFDGIHLGHRTILETIMRESDKTGCMPAVFTFRKFPAEFFLTGWDEKLSMLEEAGIKVCFWCDLEDVIHLSPEQFLDVLIASGVKTLVVGYDFHFGKERKGSIRFLRGMKGEKGFNLTVVPPLKANGEVVNSSDIRMFIKKGDVAKANVFLGRYFSVAGKVAKGSSIGNTIGFPTANLALENEIRIGEGVYAGWAEYKKKIYKAAVVTGVSPTFADGINKFEAFLIGFDGRDIYGETLKIFLLKKIRGQIKFPDKESLKKRIAADVKEITAVLDTVPVPHTVSSSI